MQSAIVTRAMDRSIQRLMHRRLSVLFQLDLFSYGSVAFSDMITSDLRSGHESQVQECAANVILMPPLTLTPVPAFYFRDLALVCLVCVFACLLTLRCELCSQSTSFITHRRPL